MRNITYYWYQPALHFLTLLLLPFSGLFASCIFLRRFLYRVGIIKTSYFDVPIIVVGNITVGGTGKTPFVIWLADFLISQGYRPGIVSRGAGGKPHHQPYWVQPQDSANEVGDEAVLLAQRSQCPVVISIDRVAAVRELLRQRQCDMVISDDGLQHYRLGRDIEIAIVDGVRRFGNGHLLPAGPLREPLSRLRSVDFVVVNGETTLPLTSFKMTLQPTDLISFLNLPTLTEKKVHAIAAIGHPERFFLTLKQAGFDVIPHVFPDHHLYQPHELDFNDVLPIIMTEKDAVKCQSFADKRYWFLRVTAKIEGGLEQELLTKLKVRRPYDSEEDFAKRPCCLRDIQQHDNARE